MAIYQCEECQQMIDDDYFPCVEHPTNPLAYCCESCADEIEGNNRPGAFIQFDKEKFQRFVKAYNEALDGGHDGMVFEGHDLMTSYAGYMIEYLEGKI